MLFTIVYGLGFCAFLLLTSIVLFFYYILLPLFKGRVSEVIGQTFIRFWARLTVTATGSTITVVNPEKLAADKSVCFVANHQSMFDIPLMIGWLGRPVGFVAKRELKQIPILSSWISLIHSVFIDRRNARAAMYCLDVGAQSIRQGHALAIFPEGTRNKRGEVDAFKYGAIKMAYSAGAVIQPVTINGTFNMYEAQKRIKAVQLELILHDVIRPDDVLYKDKDALLTHLHTVVAGSHHN